MVYNVRLVGECIDEDNDETKAFDFVFQFQDARTFRNVRRHWIRLIDGHMERPFGREKRKQSMVVEGRY